MLVQSTVNISGSSKSVPKGIDTNTASKKAASKKRKAKNEGITDYYPLRLLTIAAVIGTETKRKARSQKPTSTDEKSAPLQCKARPAVPLIAEKEAHRSGQSQLYGRHNLGYDQGPAVDDDATLVDVPRKSGDKAKKRRQATVGEVDDTNDVNDQTPKKKQKLLTNVEPTSRPSRAPIKRSSGSRAKRTTGVQQPEGTPFLC